MRAVWRAAELTATTAHNPPTSPAGDIAHTPRIPALHDGPVIPAGQRAAGGRRA